MGSERFRVGEKGRETGEGKTKSLRVGRKGVRVGRQEGIEA